MRAVVLVLTFLALPQTATYSQTGDPSLDPQLQDEIYRVPIRTFGGPSNPVATRTLAGRFNADPNDDVVMLLNGRPTMAVSPDVYSSQLQYPSAAITPDMAVLPGSGSGVDEIVTVGPSGLTAWARNSELGNFAGRSIGGVDWDLVTVLRSADVLGGSRADLIGYRWDGRHEIVILQDPDQPGEEEFEFPIPRQALDIVPFTKNPNGDGSLAIRCSFGVLIYSTGGSFEGVFPGPSEGVIVAIDIPEVTYQQLVWIYPNAGEDTLRVIENDGDSLTLSPTAEVLGSLGVTAAIAADINGDSEDDLVLSHQNAYTLRVLFGNSGAYGTSTSDWNEVYSMGSGDASANVAWPVVSDLDGDNDLDLVLPMSATEELAICNNELVDHHQLKPQIDEIRFGWTEPPLTPGTYLRVLFTSAVNEPEDTTDYELSWWRKSDIQTPTTALANRMLIDRSSSSGESVSYEAVFHLEDPDPGFEAIYFWSLRCVVVDPGSVGEPSSKVYPASLNGYTTDNPSYDGPQVQWLRDLPGYISESGVASDGQPVSGGGSGASGEGGGSTSQPEDTTTNTKIKPLPDFDDDEEGDHGNGK